MSTNGNHFGKGYNIINTVNTTTLVASIPFAVSGSGSIEVSATARVDNAALGDDGVHVVAYLGDAAAITGDTNPISGGDSSAFGGVANGLYTNIPLHTVSGFASYRLADPVIIADINHDGLLQPIDQSLVSNLLVSNTSTLAQSKIPPIPPGVVTTLPLPHPDPTLSLPTNLQALPGGTVIVPINIDTARPEDSTGLMESILAVRYDPRVFTVSAADVHLGSLPLGAGSISSNAVTGNPQAFYLVQMDAPAAGEASGPAVLEVHSANNIAAAANDMAVAILEDVFGDLEALSQALRENTFGQPGTPLQTEDSDLTAVTARDLALLRAGNLLEQDWLPTDYLTRLGRQARHGLAGSSELLDGEGEGVDNSDAATLDAFFAREGTAGRTNRNP